MAYRLLIQVIQFLLKPFIINLALQYLQVQLDSLLVVPDLFIEQSCSFGLLVLSADLQTLFHWVESILNYFFDFGSDLLWGLFTN